VSDTPLFTVFTPTFNRAHTINRVFDSLCAQTFRDFEWLVVDDGSTDGTSKLISDWSKAAKFPIRYFQQENSGKHIAYNFAMEQARGKFFAPIDSDDALLPLTLEKLNRTWNDIPEVERSNFSGIWGLCRDQHGTEIGDRFPTSPFDADLHDVVYVHRISGEKWCVLCTDVARKFPFPEIQRTYIPEGMIWLKIAKTYKTRFVNEVFRIYYVDDDKTGETITSRGGTGAHAAGRMCFYAWLLNNNLNYFTSSPMPFLKAAVMLPLVTRYAGHPFRQAFSLLESIWAKGLVCLTFPVSLLLYSGRFRGRSVAAHKL
jgi:glycosyltransferase involved in cell wall biosynthesis